MLAGAWTETGAGTGAAAGAGTGRGRGSLPGPMGSRICDRDGPAIARAGYGAAAAPIAPSMSGWLARVHYHIKAVAGRKTRSRETASWDEYLSDVGRGRRLGLVDVRQG